MKLSASMLRVLRACAAGEVVLTRAFPTQWFGRWTDSAGRNVDRQVDALRRHGLLGRVDVALTDAGRAALESNA